MSKETERLISEAQKFRRAGNKLKAITFYEKALKLDKKDIRVMIQLGKLYAELKDADNVRQFYLQAASFLTKDGFYSRAVACYKEILVFSPKNREVLRSLAELYEKLGLFNEAEELYAKLNPPPAKLTAKKRQPRKQLKAGPAFKQQFKKSRVKFHRRALKAVKKIKGGADEKNRR